MSTAVKPTIPIRDSSGNDHPVNASKFVTTIPVKFFVKSPELVDSYVPFFMTAAEIIKIKQERNLYNGARFYYYSSLRKIQCRVLLLSVMNILGF